MPNCDSSVNPEKQLLTISIVTYRPDFTELRNTLDSLAIALEKISGNRFSIVIIDNSNQDLVSPFLTKNYATLPWYVIHGQGNIGFGRAHNLALEAMGRFHLILNPDIELHPDAIINAITFMSTNPHCGLITPYAQWPDGERQYLCKQYPAVFDLMLRGFAAKKIRSLFQRRLDRYEMKIQTQDEVYWGPLIVSGCFMFFDSSILQRTNGFCDDYFLYFEDFDLSLRVHTFADIAYVPTVRIIHAGGHAAKKGLWHIRNFIKSASLFYLRHGLKIF
ncbi:rhamnosyltransferase WbbL [Brucella sp. NBRC 12953]|uniref:glycosyltransferase n=1 Tax=Brucella sp. NBRC 12953 TaxID=3075481 RepID=UPI0030B0A84A